MFVNFITVFLLVVTGNCFLLDGSTNNGGQTQTSNQFLTVSEFLQDKKILQQDTDNLRRDLDKTISLLTTQLKQKFDFLEQKVEENTKKNDTNLNYVPMDMYLALENKFNQLQNENNGLKRDYNLVKTELQLLQNASLEHNGEIRDLQQTGNIKLLQEMSTVQHAVQANAATIQSLSMNERARSQDFLALYNLTMEYMQSAEKRNNLTVAHLEGKFTDMDNKLVHDEANYNVTIDEIRRKIDTTEKESNSSIALLKNRIDEKVALTSHPGPPSSTVVPGNIIKFNDVSFSVGINNLSTYKSSGKFVCETPGLYIISVSMTTYDTGSPEFGLILNGNYITRTNMGSKSSSVWRSSTSVISRYLDINDILYVLAMEYITPAGSARSQFTIIKIN